MIPLPLSFPPHAPSLSSAAARPTAGTSHVSSGRLCRHRPAGAKSCVARAAASPVRRGRRGCPTVVVVLILPLEQTRVDNARDIGRATLVASHDEPHQAVAAAAAMPHRRHAADRIGMHSVDNSQYTSIYRSSSRSVEHVPCTVSTALF